MGKGYKRACNTVVEGQCREPYLPYSELQEGESFIRRNPTDPCNPCVYYKFSNTRAIHQNGRGSTAKMNPDQLVRRVEVVKQHIVLLEPSGVRSR